MMKTTWRGELVQLLPVAAMFALAAACWSLVPDRIPVHWNIHGEADGFGGKVAGLLMLPLVALATYALTLALPRFDPLRANYESFASAYGAIRLAITLFLATFQTVIVLVALGYPVDMNTAVGLALGIMFIVFGGVMGKIRPNWFVGVRTPWTLSSRLSWTKTHRLAGWLFIAMGLVAMAWGLMSSEWMLAAMIVFDATCVLWMVVYSYLVYRSDPARMPSVGTPAASE
jgi:uncharacterized membrane protein